jgi:hypothetical protein
MWVKFFLLFSAVNLIVVFAGRAFEDTITEDHAYYTMSLYQVSSLVNTFML